MLKRFPCGDPPFLATSAAAAISPWSFGVGARSRRSQSALGGGGGLSTTRASRSATVSGRTRLADRLVKVSTGGGPVLFFPHLKDWEDVLAHSEPAEVLTVEKCDFRIGAHTRPKSCSSGR